MTAVKGVMPGAAVFLWVVVFAGLADARTWRVEQDGSGEFATIHEAMIAC